MEEEAYLALSVRERVHWYPTTRREIVRAVARTEIVGTDLRVLEIGSGTGGNVELLREFGTLTCIEMSETARRLTRERLGDGLDLRAGTWPGEPALDGDESFDLIAMLDVLEHLDDDVAGLVAVRERLAAQGRAIITVPAYQWMWSEHDVVLHHFRRYTRASITRVLSSAGFEIIKLSYFNTILFPAAAAARLLFRALRVHRSPGQRLQHPTINSAFGWIFRREVGPLRKGTLPFGLSIIVIARVR